MNNSQRIPAKVVAAVIATGLLSFCGVIVETAMNIAFPKLMKEFNITTNIVQWITSIYLLVVAIVVPLSALLKTNFKTKKLFIAAASLFIIGIICDGIAPNFVVILLGRVIQGIGTGISLPLMFNIIMEQVPNSKLGMMMGFGNLITGVAPAIGPSLGGLIVTNWGWRVIFFCLLPPLAIAMVLGIWGIEQKSTIRKVKIDLFSLVLIAITFAGLVYGFSNVSSQSFISFQVAGAILVGLVAITLLIKHSFKLQNPILDFKLFKNLRFSGHVLIFFLVQMCSLGFAFLLPNYIQIVNNNSALTAGLIVMPAGLAGAIFAPIGGKILDKFGPKKPILFGASLMAVAIFTFVFIATKMSNMLIMVVYIFYMLGMGMMMGTVMTSALASLTDKEQTQGNGILNTLQQFAGSMGTSLAAMIVAMSQSEKVSSEATAIGSQHAFMLLACFVVIIIGVSIKVVPKKLN
ncbi:DHA2 family efflux MFS transporter permease subunit [Lactobacillus mulieris]|uniref:DHA2 family efflux MFS transporter permease subunit n=1 Tax=Lactobacillus mulieris TaxID=2508708 RepID=UPI001432B369|nr:DHA2 family efflux MFS transporter permease subunit [Lactobacillus mulieris]MCF1783770.1 DHA2 family efflux MFS transporter permease subunit [Lactobacillus mulieris]MCW8104328.1 DHA2 family efflux MFS transporter permease subunit [Lactobacillus mulieris]MDK6803262.1 DHA2 family efflux MFS transporter permease subunit [Lactobacillus mulieris]MDK8382378.1 DHA2 family efflux MFS transporter permease subunit [Lactobacillus mulieris]MDT9620607.1 DHA2 family efflux MFS transporter permease subuni